MDGILGCGDPMLLNTAFLPKTSKIPYSVSFLLAWLTPFRFREGKKTRSGLLPIFVIVYENVKSKFYTDYPSPNGKNTTVSQFKINITD